LLLTLFTSFLIGQRLFNQASVPKSPRLTYEKAYRSAQMLDALPDAIAMFDSCGRLQGCNRVMRGLLGVPELVNGTADLIDFFQRLENGLRADLVYLLPGISQAIYRTNHSSLSDARKSPFKKLTANDERFALAAKIR
jgi:PAS domain-containing protein